MKYSKYISLFLFGVLAFQSCQSDSAEEARAKAEAKTAQESTAIAVADKGDVGEAQVVAAVNEKKSMEAKLIEIFVEDPEDDGTTKTSKSRSTTTKTIASATKNTTPKAYDHTPAPVKTNTKPSTPKPVATTTKAAPKKSTSGKAVMSFDKKVFEFGRIKPGDVIDHKFKFTNTGSAPLVIQNAEVSCGCTHPSFPFVPIEPGETGFIGVTFDSKGKIGKQKPTVTLITNVGKKKIYLEGMVYGELVRPGQKKDEMPPKPVIKNDNIMKETTPPDQQNQNGEEGGGQ